MQTLRVSEWPLGVPCLCAPCSSGQSADVPAFLPLLYTETGMGIEGKWGGGGGGGREKDTDMDGSLLIPSQVYCR